MGDTLQFIKDNWAVISQAPWVFVGLIVLFGGGGLLFGRLWQSGVITNYESRLALRDDRIAEYERKLGGASPDEAGARIAGLERRLDELTHDPRLFKPEQLAKMAEALKGRTPSEITISRDVGSTGTVRVQAQIAKFFKELNWTVKTGAAFGVDNPPTSGLVLFSRVDNPPSIEEQSVVAALDKAGILYELRHDSPHQYAAALQLNFSDSEGF